jgi:hypothetical protein
VPPLRIVGSFELWVFNTKTRVVSVYYCTNNHGFSIKGTTLQNFCIDKSVSKKLRKPEEAIEKILSLQKRGRNKIMEELTTKEQRATGRINNDCILLRSDK